mmetsp:Transcript_17563/g.49605  ORF Transcript_17563/g.49605 Transcript_17563/m.49605 type:complete len:322 (-) Transcript_17563:492-1457(-)
MEELNSSAQARILQEDDSGPIIIISAFVCFFFLIWNGAVGGATVAAVFHAIHGDPSHLLILCCPHWIAGIIMPIFTLSLIAGSSGTALALIVPVGIPYGSWIAFFACGYGNAQFPNNNNNNSSSNSQEQPQAETPDIQEIPDFDIEVGTDSSAATYQRNSSILGKLILKKVVEKPSMSWNFASPITSSFRENHPKSDIVASSSAADSVRNKNAQLDGKEHAGKSVSKVDSDDENASTETSVETDTNESHIAASSKQQKQKQQQQRPMESERLCTICLEAYHVGESVAWSRNASCHHVFHTKCIYDWLQNGNDSCPICRHEY